MSKNYFSQNRDKMMGGGGQGKNKINTMMWNSPLFPAWASGPLQHTIDSSPPESVAQMNPDKSVIKGAKVWLQQ